MRKVLLVAVLALVMLASRPSAAEVVDGLSSTSSDDCQVDDPLRLLCCLPMVCNIIGDLPDPPRPRGAAA